MSCTDFTKCFLRTSVLENQERGIIKDYWLDDYIYWYVPSTLTRPGSRGTKKQLRDTHAFYLAFLVRHNICHTSAKVCNKNTKYFSHATVKCKKAPNLCNYVKLQLCQRKQRNSFYYQNDPKQHPAHPKLCFFLIMLFWILHETMSCQIRMELSGTDQMVLNCSILTKFNIFLNILYISQYIMWKWKPCSLSSENALLPSFWINHINVDNLIVLLSYQQI